MNRERMRTRRRKSIPASVAEQVESRNSDNSPPSKVQASNIDTTTLVPTGSTLMNLAMSDHIEGGFQLGKIENIIGDSHSGKTLVALSTLASVCADERFDEYRLIYDDVEAANEFNIEYLFGECLQSRIEPPGRNSKGDPEHSDTIQEAHFHILDALEMERPFIYILDSLDLLDSQEESKKVDAQYSAFKKGTDTAGTYGLSKPKYVSKMLSNLKKKIKATASLVIVISQTRDNINPVSFVKKVRSGGRALKFACCHEGWLAGMGSIKSKEMEIGNKCRYRTTKNKITGKNRVVDFSIYYDYGIDDIGSMVDFLTKHKYWGKRKNTILATDIEFEGSRASVIKEIENRDLEQSIQSVCQKVWNEIEEGLKMKRKRRF